MKTLDPLISMFEQFRDELNKNESLNHSTVEGFMTGLKALPKGSPERGKFITRHMNHGPFLDALKAHPEGAKFHSMLTNHLNSAANAGFKPGQAKVMAKSLEKVIIAKNGQWDLVKTDKPKGISFPTDPKTQATMDANKERDRKTTEAGGLTDWQTKQGPFVITRGNEFEDTEGDASAGAYQSEHLLGASSLTSRSSPSVTAVYNHNPKDGSFHIHSMSDKDGEDIEESHPNYSKYKQHFDAHVKEHNDQGNWAWQSSKKN